MISTSARPFVSPSMEGIPEFPRVPAGFSKKPWVLKEPFLRVKQEREQNIPKDLEPKSHFPPILSSTLLVFPHLGKAMSGAHELRRNTVEKFEGTCLNKVLDL